MEHAQSEKSLCVCVRACVRVCVCAGVCVHASARMFVQKYNLVKCVALLYSWQYEAHKTKSSGVMRKNCPHLESLWFVFFSHSD